MRQIKDCCFACISKCNEAADEADYTVTAPLNIVCCKSQLIEKHGSGKGSEKPFGERVLQSNSSSQFFECSDFAETFTKKHTIKRGQQIKVPTVKDIQLWFMEKRAYTAYRPLRKKYPMKKVIVGRVNIQFQTDLVDM